MTFVEFLKLSFRLLSDLILNGQNRKFTHSNDEIINSIPELDIDSDERKNISFIQDTTNAILITNYFEKRHDRPMFIDEFDQLEWMVRYPNDSSWVMVEALGCSHLN